MQVPPIDVRRPARPVHPDIGPTVFFCAIAAVCCAPVPTAEPEPPVQKAQPASQATSAPKAPVPLRPRSTLQNPTSPLARQVATMAKVGRCGSPTFSPDGRQLAFVSDLTGVPQIWTVPVKGGWPRQVTALDDQVGGVRWSPDGKWLAFSVAPGAD